MVSSAQQDLWWTMGYGLATTFINTGVSILLTDSALSFLPNLDASEMPFPLQSKYAYAHDKY